MIGNIEVLENEWPTLLDRVVLNDGRYMKQSDVDAIYLTVTGPGSEGCVIELALDPAEVVFDTLQVDYGWSEDALGYNVRYTLDTDGLVGGRTYKVTVAYHTDLFGKKYSVWVLRVKDVPSVETW